MDGMTLSASGRGKVWADCDYDPYGQKTRRFEVNEFFAPKLEGPTHMLVCRNCGIHLHADFAVVEAAKAGEPIPF